MPNLPWQSDQWIYVQRGNRRIMACMSRKNLKPGKVPCGVAWRRMDETFHD
jgi:hypothetical protein